MQFKPITAIFVLSLVVASLLVAGCTSQTASPTPSATESTASTAKMASYVQSLGYTITALFNKSDYTMLGHDQYVGFATDGKNNYTVNVVTCNSSQDTSDVFNTYTRSLTNENYTLKQTNGTLQTWESQQGLPQKIAQDSTDNFFVVMIPKWD